jgi:hypothetical protein
MGIYRIMKRSRQKALQIRIDRWEDAAIEQDRYRTTESIDLEGGCCSSSRVSSYPYLTAVYAGLHDR